MLIVFCMLLVPSVQVKHQGSDQSPRLSGISKLYEQLLTCFCIFVVSNPSRSSFKVQVKVNGFRSRSTVSGISKLDGHLLTCFCIFVVSIPSRSSFKVQVKVHGFRYIKTR
ncbi:hypothetical protein F4703DRAFT_1378138 [Phycomyces blakesleeanus]